MFKPIAAAAAVALIAAGTPATAFAKDPAETAQPAAKTKRNAATIYCIEYKTTGSRLTRKECKTRDQWIRDTGVDPLALD